MTCPYCSITTSGSHSDDCPMKNNMPNTPPIPEEIESVADKAMKCNHFMVWNIQGGYSYYRCSKCTFIDGEKTFKETLLAGYAAGRSSMKKDIEAVVPEKAKEQKVIITTGKNTKNEFIIESYNEKMSWNACRAQLLDNIKGIL